MSEPRDTRERIKLVAMDLFGEHGYDRTSLREIAERLGVTKAAIYYHFKTKEDIAASYFDDFAADVEALLEWGRRQPGSVTTRHELLRRYSQILRVHGPTMRFMHNNRPALRGIKQGRGYREHMEELNRLLVGDGADSIKQLRGANAILSLHTTWLLELKQLPEPEDLTEDALRIAIELIDANHRQAGDTAQS